jgi:hypothetical protein
MQQVVSLLVIGCFSAAGLSAQVQKSGAAGGPRIEACPFLPRPLMEKLTPGPVNKIIFDIKPHEEALGAKGSSCDYATTTLQIDPFARQEEMRRNSPGKDWQLLPGLGDTAYFNDKSSQYAELIVWTGAHHFSIQMFVPRGRTVAAVKPYAITLAETIVQKLR